jgi:hypothetical protein
MKTAEQMYEYCLENNFGQGFTKKWGLKHFRVIEKNLLPNEEVLMTFIGLHNYQSMTKHDGNYAYAITNNRILIAQKKVIGENLKIVLLNNLNDVSTSTGMIMGTITFDTIREVFNVMVDKKQTNNIMSKIHDIVFDKPKEGNERTGSIADELKSLKELLDDGILTQEEFNEQKAKILSR